MVNFKEAANNMIRVYSELGEKGSLRTPEENCIYSNLDTVVDILDGIFSYLEEIENKNG